MSIYKDFVGINICIYDPISTDTGALGGNTFGYDPKTKSDYWYTSSAGTPNVSSLTQHGSAKTLVLLNLHRNGPFGYPMWKQMRTSQNPLSRKHRKENIFTYVQEPGPMIGKAHSKYGSIKSFKESVVTDVHRPLSLVGDIQVYNEKLNTFQSRSVELKTSFGNETAFFANKPINEYYETILETDENYEELKDLYLDGGLEDHGSPIESFNLLIYRQSVYPKEQYTFLNQTRSRSFYVNKFWRTKRDDRNRTNVSNFAADIPQESLWSMDARQDFTSRAAPVSTTAASYITFPFDIGGQKSDNAEGGPGILQNRYTTFTSGAYSHTPAIIADGREGIPVLPQSGWPPPSKLSIASVLTASVEYSRLHTLKNVYSPMNPSGIRLVNSEAFGERVSGTKTDVDFLSMPTSSIFSGRAVWDAPAQSGKAPFYDSYKDFSSDTRLAGKSFTTIPEFRISNHVDFYSKNGVTEELTSIFELSGALSEKTTTENTADFYKVLSNTDFLKHFELVKNDHKDMSRESIITLKCSAIKKFLPYKGFYPADRTIDIAKQFHNSYSSSVSLRLTDSSDYEDFEQFALKPLFTPMFSPGILFNTIKSGVAVDFPLIFSKDIEPFDAALPADVGTFSFFDDRDMTNTLSIPPVTSPFYGAVGHINNAQLGHSVQSRAFNSFKSLYSTRIPFEALLEPEVYLSNKNLTLQEPHPFGLSDATFETRWDGTGNNLYKKMMSNFLAEVPEFFISDQNFKTLTSLEEQNPEFGNAESGSFYLMRLKMTKSRTKANFMLGGYDGFQVTPPQDVVDQSGSYAADEKFTVRETITMYSRPSAFGPPSYGDAGWKNFNGIDMRMGSSYGYNFPYTPPYYHGEAWCDLIFECTESKKYTVEEILGQVKKYPYYTRYWTGLFQDAMRDLTGYQKDDTSAFGAWTDPPGAAVYYNYSGSTSPWSKLINGSPFVDEVSPLGSAHPGGGEWPDNSSLYSGNDRFWSSPNGANAWKITGPQSPYFLNYNGMQLNSSVNIFGKGTVREIDLETDGTDQKIEVANEATVRGKTRWIIQTKFECPILNFNKYNDLSNSDLKCTPPGFAKSQVPRGMWHQYGDIPTEDEGIYLQIDDIPASWLRGALAVERGSRRVKSLADLVGFSKDPVRLGELAKVKEVSECVVAVPFIERDGTREFFSIPRKDIDSCIDASKREIEPGRFILGGPPKAGDSVYEMVKKMKKYVFPPSMDFVKYAEIDPFAMYIFEFKQNLSKQDLSDIWQNLSPEIGRTMEVSTSSISHELLSHELLGKGALVKNDVLDENAKSEGIPSNIQWMIFKVKKKAKTNYFDKVIATKGTTADTSTIQLENTDSKIGEGNEVTYNWPYDFFSLVELVKIDAEVTFANIENDDKGQKAIKKVEKKSSAESSKIGIATKGINIARGKGRLDR